MSGNSVQIEPTLGLDFDWPETLYIVRDMDSNRCGCYCFNGISGLATFSSLESVQHYADQSTIKAMCYQRLTFDQAREVAKKRPLPVVSMMLLDDLENPVIHFVR